MPRLVAASLSHQEFEDLKRRPGFYPGNAKELVENFQAKELVAASQAKELVAATSQNSTAHTKPIDTLLRELATNVSTGLSDAEARSRFMENGPNELEKPPRISLWMLFLIQLTSVIIILLLICIAASVAIKASSSAASDPITYVDSMAIMIIVLINASIAAFSENSANGALEALSSLASPQSLVIRDGKEQVVDSITLVIGDIVKLKTGDVVPADLRLIAANEFKVNEMLLTGEPEDVLKSVKVKDVKPGQAEKLTAENMAFSSCDVKEGSCIGVIVATGMQTRVGQIAKLLNSNETQEESCLPDTKKNQTPMQANLEKLAVTIGYLAVGTCIGVFFIGFGIGTTDPEDPETPSWLFMILIAVTLTVAAIPEGLPLCVTIALSSGCASMTKHNVLMRKIAAVETLGSASVICTDKTGTLTEGKMTLVKMFASGQDFTVTGKGFDPTVGGFFTSTNATNAKDHQGVKSTLASAVLCCNTTINFEIDPNKPDQPAKWKPRGNSSEAPLIVGAQKIGLNLADLELVQERVLEIPFSSSRKMMVTCTKSLGAKSGVPHLDGSTGEYTAHIKGAPNYIIEKCTNFVGPDGVSIPLNESVKVELMAKVDELSNQALRVLAVAYRSLGPRLPFHDDDDINDKFNNIVDGLTFCGLCASIDPERDGVKESVAQAREAGIRIIMITGDYLGTAIAIAKNIGILKNSVADVNEMATDCGGLRPNGAYVSGSELDSITASTSVFARAKPEDKLEIVKSLQRQGWVCAMTGDGVNDAPALQEADIGVSMGLEGTEVAKGASDMILTDDNFCSIVKAVEKGRIVYAGIQKFIAFIMSVHLAEVLQIFLCIVSGIPVMRKPLQILFLILITDLPPSIALAFEPGESMIMKRMPRPKSQPIVMGWMWRGIVVNGICLTISIFATYLIALHAYAGAFTTQDITDPRRESCSIWPPEKMLPSLIKCGQWRRCTYSNTDTSSDCANWRSQSNYLNGNVGKNWYELVNGGSSSDTAPSGASYGALWDSYGSEVCNICIDTSIRRARTTCFISLVWAENLRAYVSRSFENGIWVKPLENQYMNFAILIAQAALYFALYVPGLNTVLGLYVDEIHGFGWFLAFIGAISTTVLCEIYKYFSAQFHVQAELAPDNDEALGADS